MTGAPLYLLAGSGPGRGPVTIFKTALGRSGVPRARVAWVGAASGDDPALRRRDVRRLLKAGAGTVASVPLCGRHASAAEAARVIASADVVFVSGGDVEAGMRVLRERGMIGRFRALHRNGTVFIGESAGSIMLSRCWIGWTDPRDERSAGLFPCLGLARILCDTHGEADGWGELKAVLTLRPVGARGYGIASGSALVVEPDGTLRALGGEVDVFRRRKTGVVREQGLLPGPQ